MGRSFRITVSSTAMLIALQLSAGIASAAPQPSPPASPTPRPGRVVWSLDARNVFIDQQTGGPGTTPPEGAEFAKGSPLSPNTPYDLWSSAPQIPGMNALLQYRARPSYYGTSIHASLDLGAGFFSGSVTNGAYWGEPLLPTYDPHLGNQALPYAIVFPAAPGSDDAQAVRLSLLGAALGSNDGAWLVRAGYFDLAQTARFVFVQPLFTNVTPSLGAAPAESIGDGPPALAAWPSPPPGLPMLGVDLAATRGLAHFELSNAALPSLPGTSARATIASAVIDHGSGTQYAAQILHLWSGGAPISTTTLFGANPTIANGAQGPLPTSTLGGQRATLAGASASFHIADAFDATIEAARQWYDADGVAKPGTQRSGGYYHLKAVKTFPRAAATAEWFRFEPRYATAILPYGIQENVWSAAWSWPGQWLKSNYELNDNGAIGVNRQGYRLKYAFGGNRLDWRIQYAAYSQIDPATLSNAYQTGFVDGFFLPRTQLQYAFWARWHPPFGTLVLDYVADEEHRPAYAEHPEDLVDDIVPQVALTFSHSFGDATVAAAGYARYAMKGRWAVTPLDFGQSTLFAGAEIRESKRAALFAQIRHSTFDGLPSAPASLSPVFGANVFIVEERVHV